ncbi:YitT family protein [Oceanotoga sp. DSM 15011]|jgi:uncharacterized membrane-anchored protein YitT (DUF2179 family)|uniref:Uncharacterized membrane-anchored protein YitT (DUF2179 family) n=1 Tax=Oceanotoga teriensis TaxID=515440 RepID=A0AA45C8X9_9BACT|nr:MULTISPECIES: YitT family protein [Oceanotoga]MDN5341590.1 hypothetical protein [Oceanotoga sp.]MDO7977206.1 YitT family protein [Oceanotoga teriensis]PWJ96522.1 uncharacterized membrane-anchored protein YitT (DUF2179 family) [Oceanotoga teriensis]UYP00303.1 YitT family protein [Oceanotoga sp. DSM 15011]
MVQKNKKFWSYFIITLGIFVNSFGWAGFLIPSKIVGGGFTGLSTIIYYATKIPVGISIAVLNTILIIISVKIVGAKFGFKTLYGIFLSAFFVFLLQGFIKEPLVKDSFMATVIGGFLSGAGVGIYFYEGASTGGTDLITMIITHYKDISPGKVFFILDLIIIGSSYIVFRSVETMIYGFVTMAIAAYTIDMILEGRKQTSQILIISDKYDEVSNKISEEIKRGITLLKAKGWYTKNEKEVILVIVRKKEVQWVLRSIHQIDPDAFISISNSSSVYGQGFDKLKY